MRWCTVYKAGSDSDEHMFTSSIFCRRYAADAHHAWNFLLNHPCPASKYLKIFPHIQSRGSRHFITWVKVRSSVAEHVQHVATRAHTRKNARVKCSALFARSGRYCGEKNKQRVVLFVFQFDFVGKKRMTRTSSRQFVDLQRYVPEWWCIFRRACLPYMVNLK